MVVAKFPSPPVTPFPSEAVSVDGLMMKVLSIPPPLGDRGPALKAEPTLSGGFASFEFGTVIYDKVGFGPYGAGAPAPAYPSLALTYCEGG